MSRFKLLAAVLLAGSLGLFQGCANLKAETPGPFPYNSRYG